MPVKIDTFDLARFVHFLFYTCSKHCNRYFCSLVPSGVCLNETDSGWVWFRAGLVVDNDNGGALRVLWSLVFIL